MLSGHPSGQIFVSDEGITKNYRVIGPTHDLADLDVAVKSTAVLLAQLEPSAAGLMSEVVLFEVWHAGGREEPPERLHQRAGRFLLSFLAAIPERE